MVEIFEQMFPISVQDSDKTYFELMFAAGGLYKILISWIGRKSALSPEEMAIIVASQLQGSENHGWNQFTAEAWSFQ